MVESTDHETDQSDATSSTEVWSQNSDEGLGSKAEVHNFHNVWKSEFLWLIYDSSNKVMYCDVCRKAGPDINTHVLAKPNLLPKRKNISVKVLFIK